MFIVDDADVVDDDVSLVSPSPSAAAAVVDGRWNWK